MEKQNYGFATAISMVVGIVIGSGIFFKSDDILYAVNGNVTLGIIGFLIVGLGVLLGALTISQYAVKDTENIGLIGYSNMALGRKFAYLVGWFSITCYFPAYIVILAMIAAIYSGVLLDISSPVFITIATAIFLITSFTINIKSPKNGGVMQVIFTVAKIIPLLLIGFIGALFFQEPTAVDGIQSAALTEGKPLSALIAIAFAFDGWIVAANISKELKNSEKNLPKALAFGTIAILAIYMIYFYGISQIIAPADIVTLGDAHTQAAAQAILGPIGGKVIILFVILSVYGGLNGMTLAYLRLPKLLVDVNLMNNIFGDNKTSETRNTIKFSILVVAIYFVFQQLIDYGVIFSNLENGFDISSLPLLTNYIFYVVIFLLVNKLTRDQSTLRRISYLIISLLATITALMVIYGSLQVNGLLYIIVSIIISIIGIPFFKKTV